MAWEECVGIVMVTIVLLVIWVCGAVPVVLVPGTVVVVVVVRIGATVAAATGVPEQKMDFCVMVWGGWGFCPPIAGWEGRVMRVAVSLAPWGRWILMVAGGGWMVSPGCPCSTSADWVNVGLMTGDWFRVAEMGTTAVELVTGERDWIDWWLT